MPASLGCPMTAGKQWERRSLKEPDHDQDRTPFVDRHGSSLPCRQQGKGQASRKEGRPRTEGEARGYLGREVFAEGSPRFRPPWSEIFEALERKHGRGKVPCGTFDSAREKYFDEFVRPWLAKEGYGTTSGRYCIHEGNRSSNYMDLIRAETEGMPRRVICTKPARLTSVPADGAQTAPRLNAESLLGAGQSESETSPIIRA